MTQQPSRSGQDPIGDFQRWLVRSGARSVSREVSGQLRSVLGRGGGSADVWEKATAPPTDEAPECAWCPVCRAARALRESGPGVSSQVSAAGDAVSALAHNALSVFESALAAAGKAARQDTEPGQAPSSAVWADVTAEDPAETAQDPAETIQDLTETAQDPAETTQDLTETIQGPGEEPASAGPPGGPPHEPDDRG